MSPASVHTLKLQGGPMSLSDYAALIEHLALRR